MTTRNFIMLAVAAIAIIAILNTVAFAEPNQQTEQNKPPFRIAIAGLTHDHVSGLLKYLPPRKDVIVVGIAEPNAKLLSDFAARYHFAQSMLYTDLNKMLDEVKPQAVVIYTSTFDHLQIVQTCAEHHIDVMMEKPLAVSNEEAAAIEQTAKKGNIHVLVNYWTTWQAANGPIKDAVDKKTIGELRKMVFYKGHSGPKEIGCPPQFLNWLTDPKLNGGGALFDFGCYGANIATWLLNNQKPISVTAVTRTTKPDIYKNVDDDATIIINYPKVQVVIMASWSWPYGRDDIEIYGSRGSIRTTDGQNVFLRIDGKPEQKIAAKQAEYPYDDSLNCLKAVVTEDAKPQEMSTLENNMIVTEILCAARQSAQSHEAVQLK